jgi:hypothetical protein
VIRKLSAFKKTIFTTTLLLIISFSTTLFYISFRLDFMKSDLRVADVFDMLSFKSWIYLGIICILFIISMKLLPQKTRPLFLSFIFVLMFFSFFTISQYPSFSDRDYFLHGKLAKSILTKGNVEATSGETYLSYPGAFIFWACLSIVSGLDILNLAVILSFAFQICVVFFLFMVFKTSFGFFLSGLASMFFVLSNLSYTRFTIDHFCPQFFGLVLYILAFYIFAGIENLEKRKLVLISVLLGVAMTISHPITTFFLVFSFAGVYSINKLRAHFIKGSFLSLPSFNFVFFLGIMCLVWSVFSASLFFQNSFHYLVEIIGGEAEISRELTLTPLAELKDANVRTLLDTLSLYWKVFDLILFIGALYMVILGFRSSTNRMTMFLGGVLTGTIACGAMLSFTRIFWIDRIIFFILIPSSYLFTQFYAKISRKSKAAKIAVPLLALLMIPSFLTIYSFTCEYTYFQHPWEIYSCMFLSEHNTDHQLVASDYGTMIIYSYYDPRSWPSGIVGDEEIYNYSIPIDQHPLLKGKFMIRSVRQKITYANIFNESSHEVSFKYWHSFDLFLGVYAKCTKIFDNGYVQIYRRN